MTLSRLELGFESPWGRHKQVRYCRMQCRIFFYLPVLSGNGCPIEFHRLPPNRSFLDGSIDGFSLK